ncbi:unnamed protein product [Lampetra fluviatilis]
MALQAERRDGHHAAASPPSGRELRSRGERMPPPLLFPGYSVLFAFVIAMGRKRISGRKPMQDGERTHKLDTFNAPESGIEQRPFSLRGGSLSEPPCRYGHHRRRSSRWPGGSAGRHEVRDAEFNTAETLGSNQ